MIIFIFLISICIGSFMNVLIYRLPKNEDFVVSRSYCPHCHHVLEADDLVPILSYLLLKGKCRYCHSTISIQYLIIEILSGIIGVCCYINFGFDLDWFVHFVIMELCIVISFIDIKTMIIPDELNFICFLLALIRILYYRLNLFEYLLFSIGVPLIFHVMNKFYVECIGGGDIKFMFSLGFLLRDRIYTAFFIAVFSASIYALYLLIFKKCGRKTKFPFGPFLSFGCILAINWFKLLRTLSFL